MRSKQTTKTPTPAPQTDVERRKPRDGDVIERTITIERAAIDSEKRTVAIAFSSEYEVDRWYGTEILSHDPSAVRLGRLRDGGPLLVDHDRRDHVGVILEASIDGDRTGRAVVRFGRGSRASEIFDDVVDGIRSKISVSYRVHKWEIDEKEERWTARDWEPYELSFVSIPADPTVGVGRAADLPDADKEVISMEPDENTPAPRAPVPAAPPAVDRAAIERDVRQAELKRLNDLEQLGKQYKQFDGETIAGELIRSGGSVEDFRTRIFDKLKEVPTPTAAMGLTAREVKRFSMHRAILAAIGMRTNEPSLMKPAGFELEVSREFQKLESGKAWRGQVAIPWEIFFQRELEAHALRLQRDLTTSIATSTSKFGYSVATDLLADQFIDVLRAKTVLAAAGATFLPGLVGNVDIPRQNLATSVYWVGENSAPTEGAPTLDKVSLSPKTVAAFVDYSRRLMLQGTPAVEGLVRNDLTRGLFTEVDRVGIAGSGSGNQPTGVLSTSGIGSITLGTNGGAPTWAMVCGLEREVEIDNALDGALSFITNGQVAAKLRQTPRQSSGVEGNFILGEANSLLGHVVRRTQQCPSNLSKGSASGTLSAMLFGNWADLLIGLWSGIDLMVDPYTGSSAGTVRVTAFQDIDVGVRHPESFAECNEILPT